MVTYEVTQAFLSVGTVYHVRKPREEDVLYTVRGVLMSATPKFRLVEGDDGKEVGALTGNFIKTKYEINDESKVLGSLVFPAVAFKKTLTLTVGDDVYEADGGVFRGVFGVPPDLAVGDYRLIVRSPGDAEHAPAEAG